MPIRREAMKNRQEKFETVSRKSNDSIKRFRVIQASSILWNIIMYICSGQLTFLCFNFKLCYEFVWTKNLYNVPISANLLHRRRIDKWMLKPASTGRSMNRLQKRAPFGFTLLNFVLLPSMKRLTSKDLFVQFIFTRKVIPTSFHNESYSKKLHLYA